ncbi:patatin-like phospholipase family protein [Shewanella youngdeokensis]|uniref:Patatin-like phospholipase family protein n=1 Tax=Shewanella youngdeokensis TaxID=2999068 RepID=A0ABZ0K2Y7_9GAMM|nr:patatin-like phospholipase family protein [Shewanella sp. DAU334]
MLDIYAGDTALKIIKEKGFNQAIFNNFLGASGGPKWFVLYGLDKYMFGEFFKQRQQPLNLVGSSAGAFRMACFAQKDPVSAIERLAKNYSETIYTDKVNTHEITTKARALLNFLFDKNGANEIINNPIFRAHFIVAKCHGLVASENQLLLSLGLLMSFLRNSVDRGLLKNQYQRHIFQHHSSQLQLHDPDQIDTTRTTLTEANIKEALLASGAIPLVMQGIKDIAGSQSGMFRDGGIIDYHFDIELDGLTLYPHFSSALKAGWFDKKLSRKVKAKHYDKTVLICPSQQFINSLPYQKIPDRSDFTQLQPLQRLRYWQQVFADSEQLADAFRTFNQQQNISSIKNISQLVT